LLTNSPGISTVSMCATSRYISLAKCIRPDDALRILLEYELTRFLMASRNFSLYGSLTCPTRQAFTAISEYSCLSCRLRRRASLFCFIFSSCSSELGTVSCFFFWQPATLSLRIVDLLFHNFPFLGFVKRTLLNASVINRKKSIEHFYLRFETQMKPKNCAWL